MTTITRFARTRVIVVLLLAIFFVAMASVTTAVMANAKEWNITIFGKVTVSEGGNLSRVRIIDKIDNDPTVRTWGSVSIRYVEINNGDGVGIQANSEPLGVERVKFQLHRSTIRGGNNGTGLILDVRMSPRSRITKNTFKNQKCGIDVSIDVVFGHLPMEDRVDAYERFASRLRKNNKFVNVAQSVCGGRG